MQTQTKNYLNGSVITEYEKLKQWVCNQDHTQVNGKIPSARYRGTSIYKDGDGYAVVGWNRNVGQINEMVFSFPCILKFLIDANGLVTSAEMDPCFRGSKGKLCDYAFLNSAMQSAIIGKNIATCVKESVNVDALKCFHTHEVVAAAGSAFRLMKRYGKESFFEEESMEGSFLGDAFAFRGKHNFISIDKEISFRLVFPDLHKSIVFEEDGSIVFSQKVNSHFILDEELMFKNELQGNTKNRSFVSLGILAKKALEALKAKHFIDYDDTFYCSTMYPTSFVGGYVQSMALNLGASDIASFQKSIDMLRKDENGPKCIGA
jgi:hypothetical protein